MARSLTPKQTRFIDEYLVDLNAAAAARRAGYSERTARAIGAENLSKPHIAAEIQKRRDRLQQKTQVTQERVIEELARIAFADLRDLFVWDEELAHYVPSRDLTPAQAAVVSAVKAKAHRWRDDAGAQHQELQLELKTYDKLGALEKLGKHLGLFGDRVDVFHHLLRDLPEDDLERFEGMDDAELAAELERLGLGE